MSTQNISAIVVSYHTGPALWLCLESLFLQEGVKEIILVNNGNSAAVVQRIERLQSVRKNLKFISGHGNVGFARGCNMGVSNASGEFVAMVNPDCIVTPGALQRLADVVKHNDGMVMAGPRIMYPDGKDQAGYRRRIFTPHNMWSELLRLYKFFPDDERFAKINIHNEDLPDSVSEVPAISGAFMVLERSDYLAIGGMDEGYFLHVEDMDFCLRFGKHGKILLVPDVEIIHFHGTSAVSSNKVERWKAQSFQRYFEQHFISNNSQFFIAVTIAALWLRFFLIIFTTPIRRWLGESKVEERKRASRRLLWLYSDLWLDRNHMFGDVPSEKLAGRRILITGASSQVGLALLRRLLHAGANVIAVSRKRMVMFGHNRLDWLYFDLSSKKPIEIEGEFPDTVINVAPIWVLGADQIRHMAKRGMKRLVVFGSTSVESKEGTSSVKERSVLQRLKQGESDVQLACDAAGVACTILRPTMVYGLRLDSNVEAIRMFFKRMGFMPLPFNVAGKRSPVHADDLARAALSVLDNPETYSKIYNLSGGEVLSYEDMVERIGRSLFHRKPKIVKIPYFAAIAGFIGGLTSHHTLNREMVERMGRDLLFPSDEAKEDFGYTPRPFEPEIPDLPWPE